MAASWHQHLVQIHYQPAAWLQHWLRKPRKHDTKEIGSPLPMSSTRFPIRVEIHNTFGRSARLHRRRNMLPCLTLKWKSLLCISRMKTLKCQRLNGLDENEEPVYAAMLPDLWQIAYLRGRGRIFVYTNYDIIVRRDFYVKLWNLFKQDMSLKVIDNLRRDMIVPKKLDITSWTVQDIFNWKHTSRHPGYVLLCCYTTRPACTGSFGHSFQVKDCW
eukprot:m.113439 g.113439  ORF g.113439 m.113439 type:complete len:216 (+) comp15357_c0_seq5:607-1254(+)